MDIRIYMSVPLVAWNINIFQCRCSEKKGQTVAFQCLRSMALIKRGWQFFDIQFHAKTIQTLQVRDRYRAAIEKQACWLLDDPCYKMEKIGVLQLSEPQRFFRAYKHSYWTKDNGNPSVNEPEHDKTNKMTAHSEDSEQPGHPPSLFRVFAVRSMGSPGSMASKFAQRRLWSDRMDALADLSLHWAHMSFCWFCHASDQMETVAVTSLRTSVSTLSMLISMQTFIRESLNDKIS